MTDHKSTKVRSGLLLAVLLVSACQGKPTLTPDGARRELAALREATAREQVALISLRRGLVEARERLERHAQIQRVAAAVARVRRLKVLRHLDVEVVDRAFVQRFVRRSILRDYGEAHIKGYVATLARLGMLPKGYDWIASIQELLGEQGAGFYDPRTKKLYLRGDMPAGEIILAHEVAHAIQDQHYDLVKMQGDYKDNEDRSFAVSAVVEGDATLVMVRYMRETLSVIKAFKLAGNLLQMMSMDQEKIEQAPLYVREALTGTYLKGLTFITYLSSRGGTHLVNRAFRKPPASSEQILHPVKYLVGERPVKVTLPDLRPALGKGWSVLHENTLGEFGVLSLLRGSLVTRMEATRAAAGWGGDRLRSYRHRDGRMVLVWHLAWDSAREAREAHGALTRYFAARLDAPGRRAGKGKAAAHRWSRGKRRVTLLLSGKQVRLLDCDSETDAAMARRALGPLRP